MTEDSQPAVETAPHGHSAELGEQPGPQLASSRRGSGSGQRSLPVSALIAIIVALISGVFGLAVVGFNTLRDDMQVLRDDMQVLRSDMQQGFARVEARFTQVDARFDRIDARLDRVDIRLDRIEARQARDDERLGQIDERLARIDERLAKIDETLLDLSDRLARVEAVHEIHPHVHNNAGLPGAAA